MKKQVQPKQKSNEQPKLKINEQSTQKLNVQPKQKLNVQLKQKRNVPLEKNNTQLKKNNAQLKDINMQLKKTANAQNNMQSTVQAMNTLPSTVFSSSKDYDKLGTITLYSDGQALIGLSMPTQQYVLPLNKPTLVELAQDELTDHPELQAGFTWLDSYIVGTVLNELPQIHLYGTDFRKKVWQTLAQIPYGEVTTYGHIAKEVYNTDEVRGMQARAIGGAVGHNPLPIIIPCHRVVGSNHHLTGYTGGLHVKKALLTIEGVPVEQYKD